MSPVLFVPHGDACHIFIACPKTSPGMTCCCEGPLWLADVPVMAQDTQLMQR